MEKRYFAFSTNGWFISKSCWIKDHSHENLKHWGLSWTYQYWASQLRLFNFFFQVCPLGNLHSLLPRVWGPSVPTCSWSWILKPWLCILDFPLTLNLSFSQCNRANDTRHPASLLLKGRVCNAHVYTFWTVEGIAMKGLSELFLVRRHLQIWVLLLSSFPWICHLPEWLLGPYTARILNLNSVPIMRRFTCLSLLTWLTSHLTLLMLPKSWHCFWIEIWGQVLEKRHRVTLFLCQVKKEHRRLAPKLCLSLREIERGFVVRAPGLE